MKHALPPRGKVSIIPSQPASLQTFKGLKSSRHDRCSPTVNGTVLGGKFTLELGTLSFVLLVDLSKQERDVRHKRGKRVRWLNEGRHMCIIYLGFVNVSSLYFYLRQNRNLQSTQNQSCGAREWEGCFPTCTYSIF